jgi:transposase-like protein
MDYEVRSKGKIKPRRRYAPEFKQKVLRECDEGKESVAAISLKYGLNHNLVHKWRYLQRQSGGSKFVQLPMPKPALPLIERESNAVDGSGGLKGSTVRLTLKVKNQVVTADWPLDGIGASVAWLKQLAS